MFDAKILYYLGLNGVICEYFMKQVGFYILHRKTAPLVTDFIGNEHNIVQYVTSFCVKRPF